MKLTLRGNPLLSSCVQAISKIELRNEESPDILPFTHERTIQKVVVPLGKELTVQREREGGREGGDVPTNIASVHFVSGCLYCQSKC